MSILAKKVVHEELQYLQDTQSIGAILGGSMHVIYLIMFALFNVGLLFWFNLLISLPVFLIAFICSRRGLLKIPPVIGSVEVAIHQTLAVLTLGQDTGFHILLFCLIPIGILFQNWRVSFFVNSLLAFVLFLAISWFDTGQMIQYELTERVMLITRIINSIGLFTIVGVIIFYYLTLNKKLYRKQKITSEKLSNSVKALNIQNNRIRESIQYAKRIQSAVLIPEDYLSEYIDDHFVFFRPRDIVSGDFFWATHQNNKLVIAVADCTGHGVPGALLSMLGISFLNEIVNRPDSIHANQILNLLRTYFITSLHQTGKKGETKDGIEIALCVIDLKKNRLEFSGANRPLFITRENIANRHLGEGNAGHELIHIRPDSMPIGICDERMTPFKNHLIHLNDNDCVYLFSDGYVDQMGGPKRKTFRSHRFKNLLLEIHDHPMQLQKSILQERLDSWRGKVEQIDDILVLGFRH